MSSEKDMLEGLRGLESRSYAANRRLDELEAELKKRPTWGEIRDWLTATIDESNEGIIAYVTKKTEEYERGDPLAPTPFVRPKPLPVSFCPKCTAAIYPDNGPFCGNCGCKLP